MEILALKLAATPLLILMASLLSRRFGHAIGGWVVALPLTSGPVALFIALERGPDFGRLAATGALLGAAAQAAFCLSYARAARRVGWPAALAWALVVFTLGGLLLQAWAWPLWVTLLVVLAVLAWASRAMPHQPVDAVDFAAPRWDLPVRMAVATVVVITLTELAPLLGARLSGLLATFPVFASVLAVFAHRSHGPAAAGQVLRGMVAGLFGFAAFFVTAALLLGHIGIGAAFAAATGAALAAHGVGYLALWHGSADAVSTSGLSYDSDVRRRT